MRTLVMVLVLGAASVGPALAQQYLPQRSRSEQQVNEINRSLQLQQQQSSESNRSQFEVNQLRNDIQRSQQFPTGGRPGCPSGSIGC